MLSVQVAGYTQPCTSNTGGVSRIWVFDPSDMDWTQAAPGAPYTAVAFVAGASLPDGGFFVIDFNYQEGDYKATQSMKGTSVKFAHQLSAQLPVLRQELTAFLQSMSDGSVCVGLGLVIEMANGKVFVMGEKVVNGASIPRFKVIMDGTEVNSGKVFDDFNGANVMFKGDYSRPLYEFTGGVDVIEGMEGG